MKRSVWDRWPAVVGRSGPPGAASPEQSYGLWSIFAPGLAGSLCRIAKQPGFDVVPLMYLVAHTPCDGSAVRRLSMSFSTR